ncbi:hypothetical protein CIPAW_16G102300 [Carya illinoinensis]|uniref:Uncharacterized protein n=1 Tax=Carya illinoinensis TaxID=32201 RepID=A0A8T1N9P2_CARIL|nr:hypothetical protein CIPAW_16G102300 [Carya illinoinensis]
MDNMLHIESAKMLEQMEYTNLKGKKGVLYKLSEPAICFDGFKSIFKKLHFYPNVKRKQRLSWKQIMKQQTANERTLTLYQLNKLSQSMKDRKKHTSSSRALNM